MNLAGLWTAPFPSDPNPAWSGNDETTFSNGSPGTILDISDLDSSNEHGPSQYCTPKQSTPESVDTSCDQQAVRRRNKPMPRKGHTKSRRGCYSCKRRKIKCQETRPMCANCQKAEIACEYPKSTQQQIALMPSPMLSLQSTPTVFSMADLKLFHNFMTKAYPHLPVGGDMIWTLQVPAIAHEYEFLMRSMLALSASNLSVSTPSSAEIRSRALTHRVEAVKLLNRAISRPANSIEEADARFATFMNLTFQSTCMHDGLIDFLTMLRGCILQGDLGAASAFASFFQQEHIHEMEHRLEGTAPESLMEIHALDGATDSLEALKPLCRTGMEKQYHTHLSNLIKGCYKSPKTAYTEFVKLYNVVGLVSHTEFLHFIDQTNTTAQILLSHFLGVHVLLRNVTIYETSSLNASPMFEVLISWCKSIHESLDPFLRKYNLWPFEYVLSTRNVEMAKQNLESSVKPSKNRDGVEGMEYIPYYY